MTNRELDSMLRFMVAADGLKETKRAGWTIHRISKYVERTEDVADHSFSTALMSYLMAKRLGLDAERCALMALVHDLNEAVSGDIASRPTERLQKISNRDKEQLEHASSVKMLSMLSGKDRKALAGLWKEMKGQRTREAKLVKELDALDYIIQTVVYSGRVKERGRFKEFFVTAGRRISTPEVRYMYERVRGMVLDGK